MATFMELFADLEANVGDGRTLDPERIQQGLESLGQVRSASESDDERRGEPPGARGSSGVKDVGDPEIVEVKSGRYYHYLGPALLVNFDRRGMVRSLEFVGVRGGKKNANYISEVWQYDVRTQKYKYRNLWYNQGVPAHGCKNGASKPSAYWGESWAWQGDGEEFMAGDCSWKSERGEHEKPPPHFLSAFKANSETFFINLEEGTFARGPRYGMVRDVIQNPVPFLKPLIASCSTAVADWMMKGAIAITQTKQYDRKPGKVSMPERKEQAAQVAQLIFGLAACVQNSSAASSSASPGATAPQRSDSEADSVTIKSSTLSKESGSKKSGAGEVEDPWIVEDPRNASRAPAAQPKKSKDLKDPWLVEDPWSTARASSDQPNKPEDPWLISTPWSAPRASSAL